MPKLKGFWSTLLWFGPPLFEGFQTRWTQGIPVIGFTAGDVEYYRRKSLIPFDILVPKPMDFWDLHQLAKKKALTDLN